MTAKIEIDNTALTEAQALEDEYFVIVKEDGGQHRELKKDKYIADFNAAHAVIWHNHETALIANGYMDVPVEMEPTRDLAAELDALKTKVDTLEATNERG